MRKEKQFDAKVIIEKFNKSNIFGGLTNVSQIQLSSKTQYETQTNGGDRMDKKLFGNLMQQSNSNSLNPYYACESKIQLNVDDLFS